MAKKSLNMMEKMMDPSIIDFYIINCAIPSIITIENRYQIDFGKSARTLFQLPDRVLQDPENPLSYAYDRCCIYK